MGVSEKTEQRYLTVEEVAQLLRTKPYLVARRCRNGELRATKPFGRTWLIYADDIEALLEAKTNQPASGGPA